MKEVNIQTLLGKWLQDNGKETAAYELKLCKGTSLPFSSVKEHQIEGLKAVGDRGLYHKISDAPIFGGNKTRFNHPKPFDCAFLKGEAYVVICFYIVRKQKATYFIRVDDFIAMKKIVTRKSITEPMAKEVAEFVVNL